MSKIYLLSVLLLVVGGCGSQEVERKVAQRVEAQDATDGTPEKAQETFMSAPGLTEADKNKLTNIHDRTRKEAAEIKNEMYKTKAALFESIVDEKASKKELSLLKKKIAKLDRRRTKLMYKSLADVQEIFGKNPAIKQYYRDNVVNDLHGYGL